MNIVEPPSQALSGLSVRELLDDPALGGGEAVPAERGAPARPAAACRVGDGVVETELASVAPELVEGVWAERCRQLLLERGEAGLVDRRAGVAALLPGGVGGAEEARGLLVVAAAAHHDRERVEAVGQVGSKSVLGPDGERLVVEIRLPNRGTGLAVALFSGHTRDTAFRTDATVL